MKEELLNKSALSWLFLISASVLFSYFVKIGVNHMTDSNLEKRAKIYHEWSVAQKQFMLKQDKFYNKEK